jgi:hypothetical protein
MRPATTCCVARGLETRILNMVDINNQFYPGQRLSLAIGHATCMATGQLEATLNLADQAMLSAKERYYVENHLERRRF